MAYDEELVDRVRAVLAAEPSVDERRMFGGLAFLLGGHMAVAVSGQGGLLLRVDPDEAPVLVDGHHVVPMVMRGREMAGWLRVEASAVASEEELRRWVGHGVRHTRSLPPKG
ncbi:MAG TPA: TfoX/Sxy family protein [Nocardioides sp.]|nr:TfoX/Sxy family protein [Nocardioides sp.]